MLNDYLNLSTTEFAKKLNKKVEIQFLLNSIENTNYNTLEKLDHYLS